MSKNLLIVESPAKAKTIEKYLGKDFTVKSSYGHIRDLAKGAKGIEIENDFKPTYEISPEKTKVVRELKAAAKNASHVWLATDEDREGEAISWHLCEVLGLDVDTTKRIVFREITKPAIENAVKNPRNVDINLFKAQQARRILDRLVGFELSEVLWRKVKGKLSAGRVQSVAVKLIVEKEREILAFNSAPFYKVNAEYLVKDAEGRKSILKAEHKSRFATEDDARTFLQDCSAADFTIDSITKKPRKRKPAAPFTTSTLQQDASRKLGFGVQRTMSVAQRLYEAGHITYMRTDSTALSKTALGTIAGEIKNTYGDQYHQVRTFKSKSSNAQEAHEAIRPTYVAKKSVSPNRDEQRLYELIWKRTVASQMSDAELENTVVKIDVSTRPSDQLEAQGEVLVFDGFLKVYMESTDDDEDGKKAPEGILPPLVNGQKLDLDHMTGTQRFTRPPARYTEASLVKKLEELGIGRPSTYAPTITKIMEKGRGYVTKESREGVERKYTVMTLQGGNVTEQQEKETTGTTKNRLYASDIGMVVVDFLSQHFDEIMQYGFTAEVENKLDAVAHGKEEWVKMLKEFYHPFHEDVMDTKENAERASGERILGKHPDSGKTVLVRLAKYGPVVQIGAPDEIGEDEKPTYANLRFNQSMETITMDEAMELFKLPRTIGEYEGKPMIINTGRYGPYVKYETTISGESQDVYANLGRGVDPMTIEYDQALEVLKNKLEELRPIGSYKGVDYTKGIGRFGPFLKYGALFVNVPRKYDFDNLTQEEAHELIEAKLVKEANKYVKRWEAEGIDIENGRWGPFIRFKKKSIKLPKKKNGERHTPEDVVDWDLDKVKKLIEAEIPDAFKKKTRKKATTKKKTTAKKKK